MTTTRTALILTFIGMLGMSACRDKPTCLECEEAAADGDEGIPLPDLPCDGADLMTDNLNCGTCGNECGLYYPGTAYEAGSCREGVCGPGWSSCTPGDETAPWQTCSGLCTALGQTCVPNGCAGLTGMMYDVLFGEGCHPDFGPVVTLTGGCDEQIPWMTPTENHIEAMCCCDFEQPG
jgi:hypothetical protein